MLKLTKAQNVQSISTTRKRWKQYILTAQLSLITMEDLTLYLLRNNWREILHVKTQIQESCC